MPRLYRHDSKTTFHNKFSGRTCILLMVPMELEQRLRSFGKKNWGIFAKADTESHMQGLFLGGDQCAK